MNFDKYERQGAYHWLETNPRSREFNPPLVARYKVLLDVMKTGAVLDIGAGDGYLSAQLAGQCAQVLAMELEAEGARIAHDMLSEYANVDVFRGDSYQLPFADNSLDQVVMADVIEHLEDARGAVLEVARVLSPNGQFVLTTPMWREDRMWDRYHVKEYRPDEMAELLANVFEDVTFRYFWPLRWSNRYSTKIGWRLLKWLGRFGFNPFLECGQAPAGYGQMLVVARGPAAVDDAAGSST